ncbi:transcriptional regulator GlxA family with amidase domain [Pseudomonas sp. TE3786]
MFRFIAACLLLSAFHASAAPEPIPFYQGQRQRPLIAVIGDNRMTELVDFVVPYGVLQQADIADVVSVALDEGPMQMMPALRIQAEQTTANFDRQYPQGADYLIVPAVHHADDARLVQWVAAQARKGATVVGVCDGVLVLGHAGLLHGKQATGHWYSEGQRQDEFPDTRWLRDRRYISDGKVITTAGVTAALPVSLALIEALAGPARAKAVAAQLGIRDWSAHHDSSAFALHTGDYATAAGNLLAVWGHERLSIAVQPDVDEVALALRADAWSRTFRSEVVAVAGQAGPLRTRHGLLLLPDSTSAADSVPLGTSNGTAIEQLQGSLNAIAERYGVATARLVAQQLEYPSDLNQ